MATCSHGLHRGRSTVMTLLVHGHLRHSRAARPQRGTTPPHGTESPPEQLVMRRLFGTLWRTNEGHSFTHMQKKLREQNPFLQWREILQEWEHISAAVCVGARVNESLNEACEHLELGCTSAYYSLSDWHSQALVSDDRSTWLGTAPRKSALTCRHACARTHTHTNTPEVQVVWTPAAITEPCPLTGPPLIKTAGREKRRGKRGKMNVYSKRERKKFSTVEKHKSINSNW